ncbi:MAG: hypothetical protein V4485_04840 [Pseudomonadota bacterium]
MASSPHIFSAEELEEIAKSDPGKGKLLSDGIMAIAFANLGITREFMLDNGATTIILEAQSKVTEDSYLSDVISSLQPGNFMGIEETSLSGESDHHSEL